MDNLQQGDALLCIEPGPHIKSLRKGQIYYFHAYNDEEIYIQGFEAHSFKCLRFQKLVDYPFETCETNLKGI